MKNVIQGAMVVLSMAFCACGEAEAGSAVDQSLVSFEGSACKKNGEEDAFRLYGLYTMEDATSLEGLSCVSWKKVDEKTLQLDLTNFPGSCGVDFQGSAAVSDDGTLQLLLENPGCDVASCGWCTYDWSFETAVEPLPDQLAVAITVDTYPASICPEQHDDAEMDRYSLTLPLSDGDTGIVCRLQHYWSLQDYAMTLGLEGQMRMPCRSPELDTDPPCDDGLVCTPTTDDTESPQEICAESCEGDTDCSQPELFHCSSPVCTLRTTW